MNAYKKYQPKSESCETIQKLIGIHNVNYYNRILDHVSKCDKCDPVEAIRAHQVREANDVKFNGCASTSSINYAYRYRQRFIGSRPEVHGIFVWFIVHASTWNNKVKFAKWLSPQDVVDAIIHQVEVSKKPMTWPAVTYTNRFWKFSNGRRVPVKPIFSDQEQENFKIFEAARFVGADFIKKHRNSVKLILETCDIARIMNG